MPIIGAKGSPSSGGFGQFAQSGAVNYIEDVFSTYLYTGNGTSQTITNNIDLSTKGGLVWIKDRTSGGATYENALTDTVRGATNEIQSDTTAAQTTNAARLTSFNSNGFSIGNSVRYNQNADNYVSWTFREQTKFFDVLTYTGTGSVRTVAHNLGSVPGAILIKDTSANSDWCVYHRSLGGTKFLQLNSTSDASTNSDAFNNTNPTDSVFTVGTRDDTNKSGSTFVAYLFAHDAGGFGLTGTDNVISCGSFTTNGSGVGSVTLGWEPQWLLLKRSDSSTQGDWMIVDNMRGVTATESSAEGLYANTSGATDSGRGININATGFSTTNDVGLSATVIYIAIRRGPMKVPTSGTSVFTTDAAGVNASANGEVFSSTFPIDFHFRKERDSANDWFSNSRLVPSSSLKLNTTAAEAALAYVDLYDRMTGIGTTNAFNYTNWAGWLFRRAPSFFDVVCWTANVTDPTAMTLNHNLGVVPQIMIKKARQTTSVSNSWRVYHVGLNGGVNPQNYVISLNSTSAESNSTPDWDSTAPTATQFTAGYVESGYTYVAYLFATCAGVSKVGSYTGTATTKQIDCGFTAGARFVLIKRTDSTGDWYVWDTARGIVSGNDPYLLLNSTAAEVTSTDYIDTYSAGFEISSTAPAAINASGGTFIFLAIA
jgi:hypothetical protein